jgi:hypothetical protein
MLSVVLHHRAGGRKIDVAAAVDVFLSLQYLRRVYSRRDCKRK